jgi:hypothetical protein
MAVRVGNVIALRKKARQGWSCPKERENNATAVVVSTWGEGCLMTDRDLRGCKYWNASDVRIVRRCAP